MAFVESEAVFAEMAEWFKAHDWKSCDAGMYPEVQILFSAPANKRLSGFFRKSFFAPFFRHTIFGLLLYAYKNPPKTSGL